MARVFRKKKEGSLYRESFNILFSSVKKLRTELSKVGRYKIDRNNLYWI